MVAFLTATIAIATSLLLTERRKTTGSFGGCPLVLVLLLVSVVVGLLLLPALTEIRNSRRALVTTWEETWMTVEGGSIHGDDCWGDEGDEEKGEDGMTQLHRSKTSSIAW